MVVLAGSVEEMMLCREMAERDVRIGWRIVPLLVVGETGMVVKLAEWSVVAGMFLGLVVGLQRAVMEARW